MNDMLTLYKGVIFANKLLFNEKHYFTVGPSVTYWLQKK
jgi:hypothetical protein